MTEGFTRVDTLNAYDVAVNVHDHVQVNAYVYVESRRAEVPGKL